MQLLKFAHELAAEPLRVNLNKRSADRYAVQNHSIRADLNH